jgi:hypothetical protein
MSLNLSLILDPLVVTRYFSVTIWLPLVASLPVIVVAEARTGAGNTRQLGCS